MFLRCCALAGNALFSPRENGVGAPYDSFTFSLVDENNQASDPCTVELHFVALDDLPTVQDGSMTTIGEDSGAVLISLEAADVEGQVLALTVSELPTKGKLYKTSDGTLNGKTPPLHPESCTLSSLAIQKSNVSEILN